MIHQAIEMILHNNSDTAYLVASKARSKVGGYKFLAKKDNINHIINGPIAILAKIIKAFMALAAEAEVGALFLNA